MNVRQTPTKSKAPQQPNYNPSQTLQHPVKTLEKPFIMPWKTLRRPAHHSGCVVVVVVVVLTSGGLLLLFLPTNKEQTKPEYVTVCVPCCC